MYEDQFDIAGKLSMGPHTLDIPPLLYEMNRKRLVTELQKIQEDSAVVLQGGSNEPIYDTDGSYIFKQESYFLWSFGVIEPDCYGLIDVVSGDSYLFVPQYPVEYAVWNGPLPTLEEFKKKYKVNYINYVDHLSQTIKELNRSVLLTLSGINSDSLLKTKEANFEGLNKFNVEKNILYPIISNLRAIKTNYEIEVMKYVIDISSAAHRHVMRIARAGLYEYQCESEFLHYCYQHGGCRNTSYQSICGSGVNSAIIHYGHAGHPNNSLLKNGMLCLFDMGANYFGYSADITVTFPVGGKFSADQRFIYEAVLMANTSVFRAAKPGVSWVAMHLLANRVLLEQLKKGGLLQGSIDEMVDANLAAVFQPHGIGHLLGLDVHDVGGYLEGHPERLPTPGLKNLRTARKLEQNMIITIEPGCYFIDPILDKALKDFNLSRFIVPNTLKRFRGFGGVRIEDDALVTENGMVSLTKVPRTVEEIEDWMAGKNDHKYGPVSISDFSIER
ncbi:unnamed protein product [Psylliodes chrysocephalus]|uniref:Xaa-Pro dipeptidase n=1 Tax=Psylliodes chrysocephalus TaxID=3402493 RepID=A0A9P0GIC2_9CUCU|nr:unnamed protein product [Psylliodes chrysocephala]